MPFNRRIFTALLCTPLVLPLASAFATDTREINSTEDIFAALQQIQNRRQPSSPEAKASPDLLSTPDQQDSETGHQQATVRFGDTLDSIAHRYGLSTVQLMRLNPDLQQQPLIVGRQLRVQALPQARVHQLISLKPTKSGGVSWPDTPDFPTPSSQPSASKRWLWPAKGLFTSGYGWRWGRMHKGIDIANSIGTPILAVQDGRVSFAGWSDGGYGYLVEITHEDGSRSLYAHQSRILVQQDERVRQGQQIGLMGSTGRSTGPHLHFELHAPGYGAVNPMLVLDPAA